MQYSKRKWWFQRISPKHENMVLKPFYTTNVGCETNTQEAQPRHMVKTFTKHEFDVFIISGTL